MAKTVTKKKTGIKKAAKKEVEKTETPDDPYEQFRQLDEETWERIVAFSKEAERDLDDIVAEIMETAEEDYLQSHEDEQRMLFALRIVSSRITVEGLTSADKYQLLVLDVAPPKVIKTRNGVKTIANVYGVAAKYEDDDEEEAGEPSFAEVAFWDEEADKVNDAVVGQAYDVKLGGNYKEGRFQLRGTPKTNWKSKIDLDTEPLEIIQNIYEHVDLADLSDIAKQKKPVLVRGNVTFGRTGKSDGGNEWGMLTIFDNSQELDERGVSVFCSPHQVSEYGTTGSSLWVLGTVSPGRKNKETGETYAPTINGLAIIPELIVPAKAPDSLGEKGETMDEDEEEEAVDFSDFNASSESEEE